MTFWLPEAMAFPAIDPDNAPSKDFDEPLEDEDDEDVQMVA